MKTNKLIMVCALLLLALTLPISVVSDAEYCEGNQGEHCSSLAPPTCNTSPPPDNWEWCEATAMSQYCEANNPQCVRCFTEAGWYWNGEECEFEGLPNTCEPGEMRNCPNQSGVCAGSNETCTNINTWPGCDASTYSWWASFYGWSYQQTEISCTDGQDNDCDGFTDFADPDCEDHPPCTTFVERQHSNYDNYYKTLVYDENSNTRYSLVDAFGNLNRVVEFDSGQHTTDYDYDVLGNLVSITDSKNRPFEANAYDDLGRLEYTNHLDTGEEWFDYDDNHNLIYKRDNLGREKCFEFDEINRLSKVYYDEYNNLNEDCSDNYVPVIEYFYDSGCLNSNLYAVGRLCRVEYESGSTVFGYDARGRVSEQEVTIIVDGEAYIFSLEYTYDSANNLKSETMPDGTEIIYHYNVKGQVDEITANGEVVASLEYNPAGLIDLMNYGNGVDIFYDYNDRNWVKLIKMVQPGIGPPNGFYERQYTYDDVGNVIEEYNGPKSGSTKIGGYGYDDLYRLETVDSFNSYYSFNSLEFEYDSVGNREARVMNGEEESFNYITGTDRLDTVTQSTTTLIDIGYDEVGNMVTKTEGETLTEYSYDYNNMLETVEVDSEVVEEYNYDYLNQRVVKKNIPGETLTVYVYDIFGNNVFRQVFSIDNSCNPNNFDWEDDKVVFQHQNDVVAMIDSNGMMMIEGAVLSELLTGEVFEVQNNLGEPVFQVDSEGNVYAPYLFENVYEMGQTLEPQLVLKTDNTIVGLVNINDGTYMLKSCLYENYDFT